MKFLKEDADGGPEAGEKEGNGGVEESDAEPTRDGESDDGSVEVTFVGGNDFITDREDSNKGSDDVESEFVDLHHIKNRIDRFFFCVRKNGKHFCIL